MRVRHSSRLGTIGIVVVCALALASCLGDKGGNGKKGLDHQLDLMGIAPETGPKQGGTDVLIVGFNFKQDGPITDVLFGGTPAASFTVQSNNQIDAVTPAHLLGPVDVTVRNADGDEATLPDGFEFTGAPAACLSLAPEQGGESGGDLVTIATSDFIDDFTVDLPLVFFDAAAPLLVTALGPTMLEVVTPPSPAPAPSFVDVTVEGSRFAESCTFVDGFEYLLPPPVPCMEVIAPFGDISGGDTVTINSFGPCFFDPASPPVVTFGGTPSTSVTVINMDTLTCTTPASPAPGTVDVEVVTSTCSCLLPGGFTYLTSGGPCQIARIAPASGFTNGGYAAVISGSGFVPGCSEVFFGPVRADPATVVVDPSGTSIDLIVPPSRFDGFIDLSVVGCQTGSGCTLVSGFEYLFPGMGACSIASISPSQGPASGGTTVVINGSGFDADTGVLFGDRPATLVTFVSSTEIVAVTPEAIVPGDVDVTVAPGGSNPCTLTSGYTYQ